LVFFLPDVVIISPGLRRITPERVGLKSGAFAFKLLLKIIIKMLVYLAKIEEKLSNFRLKWYFNCSNFLKLIRYD